MLNCCGRFAGPKSTTRKLRSRNLTRVLRTSELPVYSIDKKPRGRERRSIRLPGLGLAHELISFSECGPHLLLPFAFSRCLADERLVLSLQRRLPVLQVAHSLSGREREEGT